MMFNYYSGYNKEKTEIVSSEMWALICIQLPIELWIIIFKRIISKLNNNTNNYSTPF